MERAIILAASALQHAEQGVHEDEDQGDNQAVNTSGFREFGGTLLWKELLF